MSSIQNIFHESGGTLIYSIEGWDEFFLNEQDTFLRVARRLEERRKVVSVRIDPEEARILYAFHLCSYESLKVVIIGEKPYAGEKSTGVAFSVENGVMTPSLDVIAKWVGGESFNPDLRRWCRQGVLMINAELTIEQGQEPISHKVLWEGFVRSCITYCSEKKEIVFMFFGKVAAEYVKNVRSGNHVLKEVHPAAVARWGEKRDSSVFWEANVYLISKGKEAIAW